ncbi:MAG: flagellar motor protein [Bacillota bacterium]|nr:flagellar motor protein [Bacillota bacterium]
MDFTTLIFIIMGFGSLVGAFVFEGGHPSALLAPTAALIVFGGTIAAVGISFPFRDVKRIGRVIKNIFSPRKIDLVGLLIFFRDLSYKTRKTGLLTIESEIATADIDPFIKKGLQLVVDGVEPSTIQGVLEMDIELTSERHHRGAAMFEAAGGFSPTMGIIGTVMGLVHVLGSLDDPKNLGPKISVAFIATLYGVGFANLLWLPIASKLKALDEEEFNEKKLMMEAMLLIQSGINPNTLVEKLKGFLDKKEIEEYDNSNKETE